MASGLNANHARALYAAAVAVDRLLADIEGLAASSDSPFRRFVDDLSPVQKQVLIAFTRAAHVRMVGALARLGVPAPAPSGSARASARTALTFAEVALQEVEPSRLRGYGTLSPEADAAIERMLADLAATLGSVREFLAESAEDDLADRIGRLKDGVPHKSELAQLERTIRERGLVALRRPLQAVVEQVESGTYEIAIFGRVSSGKSSLLNAVIERSVLPVGITPVTSVPTRLVWGAAPGVLVRTRGASEDAHFPVDELGEFVTEERNPGNQKGIARVTVEIPVERLRGGIALVDTPGLGALASSGAREAYAYMPRCDLGVIVVDGGGTFDAEDVELARTLLESGVQIEVVISKADRIGDADRLALAKYVRDQMLGRLGADVHAHWVSSVGADAALARAWFDEVVAPRIARAHELSGESARRKVTTLQALVSRASRGPDRAGDARGSPLVDLIAGEAARYLEARRKQWEDAMGHSRELALEVVLAAAASLGHAPGTSAEQALEEALLACADRERDRVRLALVEAKGRLRAWIEDAAKAGGVALDPDIVALDLTDMPTIQTPPDLHGLHVERPRFAPYRERRIAEKVAEQAGGAIESALRRFLDQLRSWTRAHFARLGAQFSSQIDPLRTDLSEVGASGAAVDKPEPSGVHEVPEE